MEQNELIILSKVETYVELDSEAKEIKKQMDPMNKAIKAHMKKYGLKTLASGKVKVLYSVTEKTSMNSAKLISTLKELGLEEAIKTIELPDDAVIQDLIYSGRLAPSDVGHCVETKFVEVLKVGVVH